MPTIVLTYSVKVLEACKVSINFRILKRHGVLVEDKDGFTESLRSVPNRKASETFRQWKIRLFGEDIKGLSIYAPFEPVPQTKMSTLFNECGSDYLISALKNYRMLAEGEAESAFESALEASTEELTKKLTTVPTDVLQEIIDESEGSLQSSAVEFLKRYINGGKNNINTKEVLTDLVKSYSDVVQKYRSLKQQTTL